MKTNIEIHTIINKSTTMDIDEKQYWLDILPIMSDTEIKTLWEMLKMEEVKMEKEKSLYSNCK